MTEIKWSLIICTYNSGLRLGKCVDNLSKLIDCEKSELIIVDNASSDDSVNNIDIESYRKCFCEIKVLNEYRQGLSFARFTGFRNAIGKYLILIDDDNLPSSNFLIEAEKIFDSDKEIGIIGGQSQLPLEVKCPRYLKPLLKAIAVGKQFSNSRYLVGGEYLWGACLCIRNLSLQEYITKFQFPLFPDRKGSLLLSAGDGEIVLFIRQMGWKAYYSENLYFIHDIAPKRLTIQYFSRLFYNFGFTNLPFQHLVECVEKKYPSSKQNKIKKITEKKFTFLNFFIYVLMYFIFKVSSFLNKSRFTFLINDINKRLASL